MIVGKALLPDASYAAVLASVDLRSLAAALVVYPVIAVVEFAFKRKAQVLAEAQEVTD